jgi:hypothetical protein
MESEYNTNKKIPLGSSDIFNGKVFTDNYRVLSDKNRYHNNVQDFENGTIYLKNNFYEDLLLKYDLYKDELILKPYKSTTNIGIIVYKEDVDFFTINEKHFFNLNLKYKDAKFINGYYELNFKGKKSTLYIKHKKRIRQILTKDRIHYEFDLSTEVIIAKDNEVKLVNSKRDMVKLFPKFKKQIESYYKTNYQLGKQDKARFFNLLLTKIDRE